MRRMEWNHDRVPEEQLAALTSEAREIGYLVVGFPEGGDGEPLPWSDVAPWTKSRAVTVAEVAGDREEGARAFLEKRDPKF